MTSRAILPLSTPRLLLRAFRAEDAEVLSTYRNDPQVARFQSWTLPVTADDAAAFVRSRADITGPLAGDWVQIAIEYGGELAGDVAVGLDDGGELATLGFTLRSDRQGRGIATEAVGAVVDALLSNGIHRIEATLDPDNVDSARLLERLGFRWEGASEQSVQVRGQWCDDDRYALLAADREKWLARVTTPPKRVQLVDIDPDNLSAVCRLVTHHSQRRFVDTVVEGLAEAYVPGLENGAPVVAWARALEADGELVGFVMLTEVTPAHPQPYLWRMLVDRLHQRRGIGRAAIGLIAQRLRSEGHCELETSWAPGIGNPEQFYRGLGFVPTGEIDDGEQVAVLQLR